MQSLKPSQKIAALLTGALLLYLLVANLVHEPQNDAEDAGAALTTDQDLSKLVKVEELEAQPHALHIVLNGATEANRLVRLKAQAEGAVTRIDKSEGAALKKGDIIMRIDVRDRKARVAQAKALLEQRRVEYDAALALNRKGVYSDVRFAQSKAQYEEAKALLATAEEEYANTFIRAPFDGVLEELSAEVGDLVGRGFGSEDTVATVVDYDPLVAVGQVPQQRRADVQTDQPATIRLFSAEEHEGEIRYVGTVTDPETRTFRVEVAVPNPEGKLPIGVSAEIRLPAGQTPAYNIAPSSLSQNDAGEVGVKLVDEQGVVRFVPVSLLEDSDKGFWVGGLPERIRLVTTGQNFVSPGQTIRTNEATAEAP